MAETTDTCLYTVDCCTLFGQHLQTDMSAACRRQVASTCLALATRVAHTETGCANGDRQTDRRTDGRRQRLEPLSTAGWDYELSSTVDI